MRQKRLKGDIFEVDLRDGTFCYGRVINGSCVLYDLRVGVRPLIEEIVCQKVLFQVWVMKYAITRGIWKVIGNLPLEESLVERPRFFKKDSISGKLYVTYDGSQEIPATLEECQRLECAAVWDPEHVEDRLRDHFEGRRNKWYDSMRPE